jgi:hypothetical protein
VLLILDAPIQRITTADTQPFSFFVKGMAKLYDVIKAVKSNVQIINTVT